MNDQATTGARAARPRFFANSALVMAAMVLIAFPMTYFAPVVTGSRPFDPIHHIHGFAFFAWIGLYTWQTHLVASGRFARHRELGLAGIALSALMLPLGLILAVHAIRRRMAEGDPHPLDFALYNVVDIASFTLLVILAIGAVTRHPDWHRRWMFGAALALVGPAISRWFFNPWIVPVPTLPTALESIPNLVADLFLIALAVHDRRTLGRIHRATWWMIAVVVPLHIAVPFFAYGEPWRTIAPFLLRLG